MAKNEDEDQEMEGSVVSLDVERSRKFLNLLAEEPFVAVVVTDGEVRVFSKGIEPDHLERIKQVLRDLNDETEENAE